RRLELELAQLGLDQLRLQPPLAERCVACLSRLLRHRDRRLRGWRMVVISPTSVVVLRQRAGRPCARRLGLVEAVPGRVRCRRESKQKDYSCGCKWRKAMPQADMVADADRVGGIDLIVIRVVPSRETFPAYVRVAMPEGCSGEFDVAPAIIAYH